MPAWRRDAVSLTHPPPPQLPRTPLAQRQQLLVAHFLDGWRVGLFWVVALHCLGGTPCAQYRTYVRTCQPRIYRVVVVECVVLLFEHVLIRFECFGGHFVPRKLTVALAAAGDERAASFVVSENFVDFGGGIVDI